MSISNTAVPKYYAKFRNDVILGKIPVSYTISLEMNRIDRLIESPVYYLDDQQVESWIEFCEGECTLTDGSPVKMLESFKLWGEELFGWYTYSERSVPVVRNGSTRYEMKTIKNRLTNKQFLLVSRGNAKTMYSSFVHQYFLNVDKSTTHQIAVAPTMAQADEVMSPIRTAIIRSLGPYYKLLTYGSKNNTTGAKNGRPHLMATKKGIQNFANGSLLEIRPMSIQKLQGLRTKINSIDEWLSAEIREDPIGAIEQGASKLKDWLILATSSEGTIRNGIGDSIKMELMDILTGKYNAPHVSIWYYRMDDISEIADPSLWIKACPNIDITVSYETYQRDIERAENAPAARNDILAKRFNIPSEGYTYFFKYEETICHSKHDFWQMPCAMGCDLSRGDDFCAFTFLFPLQDEKFGIKTRAYITDTTLYKLQPAMKEEYHKFMDEGSLIVFNGTVLDLNNVYDDLERHIDSCQYDVECVGYDPYNAKEFINRWTQENGPFGVEKVIQGAKTESVPLGELKKLAEGRQLIFDERLMHFCMGNCITIEDTNGNRKLYKPRQEAKIDSVAAMMDAFVAYKLYKDLFD